jgi:hypothetical protein
LKPDLVGVAFVLNDLHRFLHSFRVKDGKIVGQTYDFTPDAIGTVEHPLYQFARKSRFLVWLRRRFSEAVSVFEASDFLPEGAYTFELRPDFNTAWRDGPWNAIRAQLSEMKHLGDENGFKLFVVAFPFGQQYRSDYLKRDQSYVMKPQRKLHRITEDLDIPLLDLYPLLDVNADLVEDEIHLSAGGRRKVGFIVASFLQKEGLVPSRAR